MSNGMPRDMANLETIYPTLVLLGSSNAAQSPEKMPLPNACIKMLCVSRYLISLPCSAPVYRNRFLMHRPHARRLHCRQMLIDAYRCVSHNSH